MTAEDITAADDDAAAPGQARGKRRGIWIVLGALALLGIAGGAAWQFGPAGAGADAAEGEERAAADAPAVYYTLASDLVVNFDTDGRIRYLQLGIDLMTREPEAVEAIETHAPVLRNNLIMLLSDRSYEELMTRSGKEALQQDALAEVRTVMKDRYGSAAVETLYFTSFVMQ